MADKSKKPEIRFEGFSETWEQRELGEIADIVGGGTPSTAVSEYWDGDIDWYAPAEISDQIFINSSQRKITTEGLNNSSAKMLPVGTVLFTSRAGIGKTAILAKEGCTNQGFQSIIPHNNELDSYFIFSRTDELKRYGETVGAGSTFVEVSGKQMANMTIAIPQTMQEQQQIGSYFRNLDHLITLHQRKYEKLIQIKKSMLEKMFPKNGEKTPEIRFAGFTDDWEQRKLSDAIVDIADGPFGSNLKTEHYTDEKEARIIQLSNLSDYGWQEPNTRYTTFEHAKEIRRCIVNEGDLVMGKMMPAGMTIIRPNTEKMYVLSSDCVRIKLDKSMATDEFFLYTTKSETFLNQVNNDSQGSTRVRTSISKIREMNFATPSLEEQAKIGEYFSNLDHLITLHQRKYEKLIQIKKSMLEKMFV